MVNGKFNGAENVQLFNYWFGRLVLRNATLIVLGVLSFGNTKRYGGPIFAITVLGVLLNTLPMLFPVLFIGGRVVFLSGQLFRWEKSDQLVLGAERTGGVINTPVRLVLRNVQTNRRFSVSSVLAPNLRDFASKKVAFLLKCSESARHTAFVDHSSIRGEFQSCRCFFGADSLIPEMGERISAVLFVNNDQIELELVSLTDFDEIEGTVNFAPSGQKPKFGDSIVFGVKSP